MKKTIFLCLFLFGYVGGVVGANKLVRADVSVGRFGPQIIFEFSSPLDYTGEGDAELIKLYFRDISLSDFQGLRVKEKLLGLPSVEWVVVGLENKQGVMLTIKFKRDFVFRFLLTKMEGPNYLICNIFEKKEIDKISRKSTVLEFASNDSIKKKSCTLSLIQEVRVSVA